MGTDPSIASDWGTGSTASCATPSAVMCTSPQW